MVVYLRLKCNWASYYLLTLVTPYPEGCALLQVGGGEFCPFHFCANANLGPLD